MALPSSMTPEQVAATFDINGIFAVGVQENGVTLYNQQVRAHNLIWALSELDRSGKRALGRVAIIGAGAAGLTATAALLSCTSEINEVCLFEKEWDLCPVQQGCDGRWLHPSLYAWPDWGSRAPSASLPVLNWSEGRASDVARTVLNSFAAYLKQYGKQRLKVFLGVHRLQINSEAKTIDFIGNKVDMNGAYFTRGESEGDIAGFDTIILAAGFGWERTNAFITPSYWRNEQLAQPNLRVDRRRYVVSGSGDGALIDVCRLSIERFRQDTILYELFESNIERAEEKLRQGLDALSPDANLFDYFASIEETLLRDPKALLRRRLRKDTAVTLHVAGPDEKRPKDLRDIFGRTSSRLNRLLIYLLYRCGAISVSRRPLIETIASEGVKSDDVLCRYGCDTNGHLQLIFEDYATVKWMFADMKKKQAQQPKRYWDLGYFPVC